MSKQPLIIMPAAWLQLPITEGDFKVLAAICQFAHLGSDDGCLRSHESLGELTGLHKDSVKRSIRRLKALGVVTVETRGGGPGERSTTNRILPNWDVSVGSLPSEVVEGMRLVGEGGATVPRGTSALVEGGRTVPHKHSVVSTNSSSPSARDETLAERFADPDQREAYEAYRRSHRMPTSFDAGIRTVNAPTTGGAAYDWPVIGAALLDMRANQGDFSVAFLRGCCRRIAAGEPAPRSRAFGDGGAMQSRELAGAFWGSCKAAGILTAPSRESIDEGVDKLVSDGSIADRGWFLAMLEHVKPWEFANARTADRAIDRVAERMATFKAPALAVVA